MAGFRFADLYGDLEALAQYTGQRALVKRLINEAVAVVASTHEWPELWDRSFFTTVAAYTTGTVAVTEGLTTVTGTGTTFTAAMVGRKFRAGSDTAYYVIAAFVSTTEVTLEAAYQGTTATGATYSIYQDEYRLLADVDQVKLLRQLQNGVALISTHPSAFDLELPAPSSMGPASYSIFVGTKKDTYSTGTVSMSVGRTLLGSSTAWTTPQGLGRGTKLQIGSLVFTVRSVDNATQITTYEAAATAISASTSYVALLDNAVMQLYTIPNTAETYPYRYQRIPALLDADQDFPDLPLYLHPLIKPYVLQYLWEAKGLFDRKVSAQQTYDRFLATALRTHGMTNPDRVYRRRSADRMPNALSRRTLILQ